MTNGADLAVGPVAVWWIKLCLQATKAPKPLALYQPQRSSPACRLILGWKQLPEKSWPTEL